MQPLCSLHRSDNRSSAACYQGSVEKAKTSLTVEVFLPKPTNLRVSTFDRTLTFTWDGPNVATSYYGILTDSNDDSTFHRIDSGTKYTANGLENGSTYSFKVQAGRDYDGDGEVDEYSRFSQTVQASPTAPEVTLTGWEGVVGAGESYDFRLRIDNLSPTRSYQVRLDRENAGNKFGFVSQTDCYRDLPNVSVPDGDTIFSETFDVYGCFPTPLLPLGATTTVKAVVILADTGLQARPCHAERLSNCEWRRLDSLDVEVKLTIFHVEPRPLRKVRLRWQRVPNATNYQVEIRHGTSGTWQLPVDAHTAVVATSSVDLSLDELRDTVPNLVRVTPYMGTQIARASDASDPVSLIDNPILATGRAKGGDRKVSLEWASIAGGNEYIVRYRLLGPYVEMEGEDSDLIPHTDTRWPDGDGWPYYGTPEVSTTTNASLTITGLTDKALYAFQVNYTTLGGQRVYSARDAYAWASDDLPDRRTRPPDRGSRVGTYPFFGFWEDGTYKYRFCTKTFSPATLQRHWGNLVEHAFEQWEDAASPDLIAVEGDRGACESYVFDNRGEKIPHEIDNAEPLSVIVALHNKSNEVYMVDDSTWTVLTALIHIHNPLFTCVSFAEACVISTRYTEDQGLLSSESPVRILDAGSVDVLVNVDLTATTTDHLPIPGGDKFIDPNDAHFSACYDSNGRAADFHPYEVLVHEAGHALGLSNFISLQFTSGSVAHPSIPDSVMNYDSNVKQIRNERDCSPHAFDIMALEVLYRNERP